MKEESLEEQLFDYLAGTLDQAGRQAFEARLKADPALAARVALEREIDAALGDSAENAFRANLERIGKTSTGNGTSILNRKLILFLLLFLLISTGFFLYFRSQRGPWESGKPSGVQELPLPPQNNTPIAHEGPASPSPSREKMPIADVYRPIPRLDQYLHSQIRSGALTIQLSRPGPDAAFIQQNGKINLRLEGKAVGKVAEDAQYKVLIFNNDIKRFEAMQAVKTQQLPLRDDAPFAWQTQLHLSPGLYYLLIEEENSGEWLYVGRFQVR